MKISIPLIIGFVLLAVWIPQYVAAFNTRHDLIQGCERANVGLRTPLYDFLRDAESARKKSAQLSSGPEREANLAAAEDYGNGADIMVNSVPPGIRIEDDRPEVNCDKAYDKPFPF